MLLEIIYIVFAVIIVAAIGIPYVIYHKKYKELLRELEDKDGDE